MGKKRSGNYEGGFDGKGFTGAILVGVLLSLLVFGSKDIEDLTDAPD
ncbi:hypothetical protein [Halalkalibacter alkaliphilus]|uniref:Uncharacterized protein n=1 Tax=Halalkalibacter alkaliphilus TaxID=2917993 RepID=A0A9X2CW80_9BACI|nr:hypothetical protein [Halalkalibacter alkaliphilus]MCL7749419.1 hypothetical protein [Halalkalibacter alkaliphilus]